MSATFARRAGRTNMKGNVRPSLFNAAVGFDDPLEMLLACHRRIERQMETLRKLQAHIEKNGVDVDASIAAQSVLRYFAKAASDHTDDEEKDLFPLLEERIPSGAEKAKFNALRERLEGEHREAEAQWTRLRKALEAIADGRTRPLTAAEVESFANAYASHIAVEEAALHEFFARWIDERDRANLGRRMRERRTPPSP